MFHRVGPDPRKLARVSVVIHCGKPVPRWTARRYSVCYTVKDTKAWHRQGSQKHDQTQNRYSQPKRPASGSSHKTSTGLHRNSDPQCMSHNTRERSNPACTSHPPCQHHTDPWELQQRQHQSPLSRPYPERGAGGPCRTTTRISPATAGTRGNPSGGLGITRNW